MKPQLTFIEWSANIEIIGIIGHNFVGSQWENRSF